MILAVLIGVLIGLAASRLPRRPAPAPGPRSTRSEPVEITAAKAISCALRDLDGPRACRRVLTPAWDLYVTEAEEQIEQTRVAARAPRPIQVVMPVYFEESAVRH